MDLSTTRATQLEEMRTLAEAFYGPPAMIAGTTDSPKIICGSVVIPVVWGGLDLAIAVLRASVQFTATNAATAVAEERDGLEREVAFRRQKSEAFIAAIQARGDRCRALLATIEATPSVVAEPVSGGESR